MKTLKLIGTVFALTLALPAIAADVGAGQKIAEATCAACHGAQGNKPAIPGAPRLAGQHEDYLLKALNDYKSGARKNGVMAPMAANLSKQDMQNVAAYFAAQPDGLVLKK